MSDVAPQSNAPTSSPEAVGRRFAGWIVRLAELATLAAGMATLGALGAAYAWFLELLSHFRVQFAVALLILAGLFALCRRFRWTGAALGLFAVNAWFIAPFVLPISRFSGNDPPVDATRLTLASINVYSGNPTPDRVIEYIGESRPDVIVVLEVTPEWEDRLAQITATYPHSAVQSRTGNFGIAMYSRLPLHDVEFVPLSENNHAISTRIEIADRAVHVIAAHPFPPAGSRGADLRNRQLRQLATLARQHSGSRIVAGDLNITSFSPHFDAFLAAAGLNDPRRGQGLLPTWPSHRWPLWIPIDHCLVSNDVAARLSVGAHIGSDHRPLVAELHFQH